MDEDSIDPESPDDDWDSYKGMLKTSVFYAACTLLLWIDVILSGIVNFIWALPFPFTGIYGVILVSLLIRVVSSEGNRWLSFLLQFVNTFLFMLTPFIAWVSSTSQIYAPSLYAPIAAV